MAVSGLVPPIFLSPIGGCCRILFSDCVIYFFCSNKQRPTMMMTSQLATGLYYSTTVHESASARHPTAITNSPTPRQGERIRESETEEQQSALLQ